MKGALPYPNPTNPYLYLTSKNNTCLSGVFWFYYLYVYYNGTKVIAILVEIIFINSPK